MLGVSGLAVPHSAVHVVAIQRRGGGRGAAEAVHSGALEVERREVRAAPGDDQQALQARQQGDPARQRRFPHEPRAFPLPLW